jgi:hypothetical protein
MGTGKCAGNRPPPCGRGKNCKSFESGFRCGAHAPVGGCAGHGTGHGTVEKPKKGILGSTEEPLRTMHYRFVGIHD